MCTYYIKMDRVDDAFMGVKKQYQALIVIPTTNIYNNRLYLNTR